MTKDGIRYKGIRITIPRELEQLGLNAEEEKILDYALHQSYHVHDIDQLKASVVDTIHDLDFLPGASIVKASTIDAVFKNIEL